MRLSYLTFLVLLLGFAVSPLAAAVVTPPVTPAETEAASQQDALDAAKAYQASLKELSGRERRQLKRQQQQEVKQALREHRNSGRDADTSTILLVILAILLPPVAVLVHQGELNSKFWIALLLTLLFYLPGLIYALLVIFGNA